MLEKQDNQTQEMVEIPHDYLIEGVRKAVDDVDAFLAKARKQHGENYNWKNHYETFGRRFGYTDAEKIWQEFTLVVNKRSSQPAAVRHVIEVIGSRARSYAILRMRQDYKEQEQKKN